MNPETELLRGTEEEIERALDSRRSDGFDGSRAQDLTTGEWVLLGTPVEWYEESGHGVEGQIYKIEGLVKGRWMDDAVGGPNEFDSEEAAEGMISELARIYKCPEDEFRVVLKM